MKHHHMVKSKKSTKSLHPNPEVRTKENNYNLNFTQNSKTKNFINLCLYTSIKEEKRKYCINTVLKEIIKMKEKVKIEKKILAMACFCTFTV